MLGPCCRCGGFGHLAATCPVKEKTVYPLHQPVVSSAELFVVPNHQLVQLPPLDVCVKGAHTEPNCPSASVDNTKVEGLTWQVLNRQSVNHLLTSGDLDGSGECVLAGNNAIKSEEIVSKFWEVEVSDTLSQVTDV